MSALVPAMVSAGLFAAGCGGSGSSGDVLSFAPPEAFGVIHIELKPLVNSVLTELQKQGADLSDIPVDEVRRTAEKAAVMDVFLISGAGDRPLNVCGIVRGGSSSICRKRATDASTPRRRSSGVASTTSGSYRPICSQW